MTHIDDRGDIVMKKDLLDYGLKFVIGLIFMFAGTYSKMGGVGILIGAFLCGVAFSLMDAWHNLKK